MIYHYGTRGLNNSFHIIISSIVIIITPMVTSILILSLLWLISSIGANLYTLSEKGIYTQVNAKYYPEQIYGTYTLVCELGIVVGPLIIKDTSWTTCLLVWWNTRI